MKRKPPQRLPGLEYTVTSEESPDLDTFVPEGMIRLAKREFLLNGEWQSEIVAPGGHPVYPTLIGVDCANVMTAHDYRFVGTVHWATPEAVALSAEIYAAKLARGELPHRGDDAHQSENSDEAKEADEIP